MDAKRLDVIQFRKVACLGLALELRSFLVEKFEFFSVKKLVRFGKNG